MKLSATREQILTPLQSVIGVVERRQTMPVLSNVLLAARNNRVSVTGTDLEVELVATGDATVQQPGDITVPGRKFLDILRALPEKLLTSKRNAPSAKSKASSGSLCHARMSSVGFSADAISTSSAQSP